jgi:hypothetical protein
VAGFQALVGLADPAQVKDLVDQRPYLTALQKQRHLVEARPLAQPGSDPSTSLSSKRSGPPNRGITMALIKRSLLDEILTPSCPLILGTNDRPKTTARNPSLPGSPQYPKPDAQRYALECR